ncbi:unnamed protein product [Closterium sp. NIES-53]
MDAHSRHVWIANVGVRSQAPEVFRIWLVHAQRQSGKKLKIWQTGGAKEICSHELESAYRPTLATTSKFTHHARWEAHLGRSHEYQGWLILDIDNKQILPARDVLFYERLTLQQWIEDKCRNVARAYANNGRIFATPKDEVAATTLDRDPADEHPGVPPRPRNDDDDDDDDTPAPGPSRRHPQTSTSSPAHESDDDDVVEVTTADTTNVSGLQLLGLHTSVTTLTRAVEPKNPRQALTGATPMAAASVQNPPGDRLQAAAARPGNVPPSLQRRLNIPDRLRLQLYQQQLGCLLFASVTCRPDLSYIASQLAQYSRKPVAENQLDLERALQYFISTPDIGLSYSTMTTTSVNLKGYVDADHAADPANQQSQTGFVFRLEPTEPISWNSQKQELVALSSAEAEYITATVAVREGLYLQELLQEAKIPTSPTFSLHCDNQSAIKIANKPGFVNRTKHIALRYFFVKDEIDQGKVDLAYCPTTEMAADFLTKRLPRQQLKHCSDLTGVVKRVSPLRVQE